MGDYLRLNKRETLKEMTAEIEAMFFRFFSKHPEIDISNTSGSIILVGVVKLQLFLYKNSIYLRPLIKLF